ncbi:MAG: septal ring lytic transglycosylase RlpA family protein [Moorea sp. SIO2B7]|nr:septal ring lytic transglycosylase RlpA family protein [Moorena sp. SIO2B7]
MLAIQKLFGGSKPVNSEPVEVAPPLPVVTLINPSQNQTSLEKDFQIWVNGNLVAKIPNQEQARSISEGLENLLSQPDFNALKLKPAFIEEKPGGKMGDRLIFVIDDETIPDDVLNGHLLAIRWVNNLRRALNVAPLELVEAQRQMYGLVETSKKFEGLASWYGPYFHGRLTANGETYNQNAFTAAHPSMRLNTYLKVTNLYNQKTVIIRLNDRGPYIPPRNLDLSLGAAHCIDSVNKGVIPYKAVIMERSSPESTNKI